MTTSFQVTISGWLGIDDSGYDVPKAITALPRIARSASTAGGGSFCLHDPGAGSLKRVETTGGHHFDGDYDGLAARLWPMRGCREDMDLRTEIMDLPLQAKFTIVLHCQGRAGDGGDNLPSHCRRLLDRPKQDLVVRSVMKQTSPSAFGRSSAWRRSP